MKERPILFQAEMVRALRDGSKTQTRRIAKLTDAAHVKEPGKHRRWHPGDPEARLACPYGQPGDRLWVRETWAYETHALSAKDHEREGPWVYAADGETALQHRLCDRWRPSIHMFRAASRITLEVTGVRLEHLQDIIDADALAEGINSWIMDGFDEATEGKPWEVASKFSIDSPFISAYAVLWEQINGPGSWAANPWVWVVEFKVVKP